MFNFKHFTVVQGRSPMKVGTDALILGAMVETNGIGAALDIGAGTGVLSLMLAQRFPELFITAVELDMPSAEDCSLNFKAAPWSDRLKLIQGDFLTYPFPQQFELIISNPPFYSNSLPNSDVRLAQSRHEAYLPFRELIRKSSQLLSPGGSIWLIVPFSERERIIEMADSEGLHLETDCSVNGKPGKPVRSILSFTNRPVEETKYTVFTIRDAAGTYTEEYRQLTREFHDRRI